MLTCVPIRELNRVRTDVGSLNIFHQDGRGQRAESLSRPKCVW